MGFDVTEPGWEAILQLPEGSWEVAITKELEEREREPRWPRSPGS